jgi:hypothetical protein
MPTSNEEILDLHHDVNRGIVGNKWKCKKYATTIHSFIRNHDPIVLALSYNNLELHQ